MTEEEIKQMSIETVLSYNEIKALDRFISVFDIEEIREHVFIESQRGDFIQMIHLIFFIRYGEVQRSVLSDEQIINSLKQRQLLMLEPETKFKIFKEPKQKYTCHGKRKSW